MYYECVCVVSPLLVIVVVAVVIQNVAKKKVITYQAIFKMQAAAHRQLQQRFAFDVVATLNVACCCCCSPSVIHVFDYVKHAFEMFVNIFPLYYVFFFCCPKLMSSICLSLPLFPSLLLS